MSRRLIYSRAVAHDLANVVEWLTQPGSGDRAHKKLDELMDAVESLPDHPLQHPQDRHNPGSRLAIVHGYAVRFQVLKDGFIVVERIFGPGQQR
jgi:plasmid stabilization system protein ParE